jgi:hypothetical protein
LLLILGISLAGVAWWYQYLSTQRCLAYWGAENVRVIRQAERAEYWQLERVSSGELANENSAKLLEIGGQTYRVSKAVSVMQAPGYLHARDMLLSDDTFSWEQSVQSEPAPDHLFGLAFFRENRTIVVAFDPETWRMWSSVQRAAVDASPQASFWKRWFAEREISSTPQAE